jgi:hypothetical protein
MKKFAGILLMLLLLCGAGHGFYLTDRETACKEMEAFLNEIDQ